MERSYYLKQNENCSHPGKRTEKAASVLHGSDKSTHGDGEYGGQYAAKDKHKPPCRG
jgi:hypothetical protein